MLMGLLFFSSGLSMLLGGPAEIAGYFASLNVPMATIVVWPVIALKIIAGLALMLGHRTGLAAGLLIIFTLLTIPLAHADLADTNLWKNLAIVGGLLYALAYGPGQGWRLGRN
jgi:putative oxidoreductase